MTIPAIRLALGEHLGKVLTPEIACAIELQATTFVPSKFNDDVVTSAGAVNLVTIEKMEALEREMLKGQTFNLPVQNFFAHKCYARQIVIPAGTVLTGRIHKFQNLNILSGGEISVLTDDGIKRISAPFTVSSPPGTKRVAYAHTETTWTTICGTELLDVDEIEKYFTTQHYSEYLEFCHLLTLK